MVGSRQDPGECPMCGEQADFVVSHDETVTPTFPVPTDAVALVGHYDPEQDYVDPDGPTEYYFHFRGGDG